MGIHLAPPKPAVYASAIGLQSKLDIAGNFPPGNCTCFVTTQAGAKWHIAPNGPVVAPGPGLLQIPELHQAVALRKQWMQLMGLEEDEIAESLQTDPPQEVEAERKQLRALEKLKQITPSSDVLRQVAIKY